MMANHEMGTVFSKEHGEEICYYLDDLNYSYTVLGGGLKSGKPYEITFDEEGKVIGIELMED